MGKIFPSAAHAAKLAQRDPALPVRAFDPYRFRAVMPDRWMSFLRAHFRGPEEVAFVFGVNGKTALNWWEGAGNRPTGDKVALAAVAHPEGFAKVFRAA